MWFFFNFIYIAFTLAEELQNGGDEPSPDDKRKKKKERQKRKKDKKRNELSSFAHTSEVSPSTCNYPLFVKWMLFTIYLILAKFILEFYLKSVMTPW